MITDIIQEYANSNIYWGKPKHFDIEQHEGNALCGDDITVYIDILDNKIQTYHFDGNCSLITKAAANFLGDIIIEQSITKILERNYNTLQEEGLQVSARRKRAAVISLLAVRNAIHTYKKDQRIDTFDDLIDEY